MTSRRKTRVPNKFHKVNTHSSEFCNLQSKRQRDVIMNDKNTALALREYLQPAALRSHTHTHVIVGLMRKRGMAWRRDILPCSSASSWTDTRRVTWRRPTARVCGCWCPRCVWPGAATARMRCGWSSGASAGGARWRTGSGKTGKRQTNIITSTSV